MAKPKQSDLNWEVVELQQWKIVCLFARSLLMLWFALMEYSQRRNNQSASSH